MSCVHPQSQRVFCNMCVGATVGKENFTGSQPNISKPGLGAVFYDFVLYFVSIERVFYGSPVCHRLTISK